MSKLLKTDDITTETFWVRDRYMVDIQTTPEYFDAYLYSTGSGVKRQIFGFQRKKITYPEFIYRIQDEIEDYIDMYDERLIEEMIIDELYDDDDEDENEDYY